MSSVKLAASVCLPILPSPSHNSGRAGILISNTATRATAIKSNEKEKTGYTLPMILSIGNIVAMM